MEKQTKPKPLGAPMAKMILAVAMIISLGALFGAVGYLAKNKLAKIQQPQVSPAAEPDAVNQVIDKTADWKIYLNPEVDFTFKYPKDWEISQDYFYEWLSGEVSKKRTIVLRRLEQKDSNDLININMRQFQCDWGRCSQIYGNEIGTYSSKSETLAVFDKIIKSFEKKDETTNWQTYTNKNWIIKLPPTYERSNSNEEAETDVFMEKSFQGINIADLPTETPTFSELAFLKIQTKPADISLFQYVQSLAKKSNKYDDYFQKYVQSIKDPENINISDKSIIQTELVTFEGCPLYAYWFEKSPTEYIQIDTTKCFEIGAPFGVNGLTDKQRSAMEKEVQQILSTFQFTEK